MKFKYYDTLCLLVTGSVSLFVLSIVFEKECKDINAIFLLALAYVLGYLINALGAFLEPVYFLFFGGMPSDRLLTPPKNCRCCGEKKNYTGFGRIRLYEYEVVISFLKEELNDQQAESRKMFGCAMLYSNSNEQSRVPDFNAQYAFSRSMLTLSIIVASILSPLYYNIWWAWLIVVVTLCFVGCRCKECGYYYAKEVLVEYLKVKKNKK